MKIAFLENEVWWGTGVVLAKDMPFDKNTDKKMGFLTKEYSLGASNQVTTMFLSNKGRYIWINEPYDCHIKDGFFDFSTDNLEVVEAGNCLRDAYHAAKQKHFPFKGDPIEPKFFETAQYNTWIELMYNQNQKQILEYARKIVELGFKPGILMIDEGWQQNYGIWDWHTGRFPDPKAMVDELHELGFSVMLWVVPWVAADSAAYRKLTMVDWKNHHFLRTKDDKIALMEWWNGVSVMLDSKKEVDMKFLGDQLQKLVDDYGIDGFKFDGGSTGAYTHCLNGDVDDTYTEFERNLAWNEFGYKYKFHEYKDSYNCAGLSMVSRLCDKLHRWDRNGLNELIPNGLVCGILGYPFICPDMIGGGEYFSFLQPDFKFDQELFIRMCQCSTFFPMMQYSLAPWRVLSDEYLEIAVKYSNLHSEYADYIVDLVNKSTVSGEPIIKMMEYSYPGNGYEYIVDQFLLGDDMLIAPVITKGATTKDVVFPEGKWEDQNGNIYEGPAKITVKAPIEVLPYFKRVK